MSSTRPTRSLRKRNATQLKFADDYDFDLEDLLKEHEQKGIEYRAKRDAKKSKSAKDEEDEKYADAFKGYDIPFDTLPALCIERIYAMLDSPQDLFNLAFSSKFLMSLVTPETVIRSAVFNNLRKRDKGNRKTMSNIMSYINNRSIHIPSAHRMLRLLNARQCERGDRCWGKNLNTGAAMPLNPNSSCRPFGLALCDKCVKYGTTKVPYSHFSRFQHGVAFHQWNLLIDPQRDPKSGDVHGPLIEVLQLQQIENTYTSNDDKKSALEGIVQKALTNEGKYCPIHYEEKAAAYQEIHENAEKEADEHVAAELEKDQQKYRERREERIAKRMTRIRSIYQSLEEILNDCPLRELALDCTWLENDERCIKFSCHVVEQKLNNIISAPASASERSINNAATNIKQIFNTLNEKNFFQFSYIQNSGSEDYSFSQRIIHFLNDNSPSTSQRNEDRFRRGMYQYCTTETSPAEIMKSSMAGDVHFLEALEQDKPVKALVRALNRMRGALPRIFALSVVRSTDDQNNADDDNEENRVDDYRKLAEVVWNKKAPHQYGSDVMTFQTIKETFSDAVEEFRVMKKNARDYMAEDDTRRFLLRDAGVGGRPDNFTRDDAVAQVFVPKTHTVWVNGNRNSAYDHVRNRNFNSLRNLHEQYFRRPSQYGVSRLNANAAN